MTTTDYTALIERLESNARDCNEPGSDAEAATALRELQAKLGAAERLLAEAELVWTRLADCERSLDQYDLGGDSEYWLRYPEPAALSTGEKP
jgi:hypothetical protein